MTYQHVLLWNWGFGAMGLFFDWTGRGNGTNTSPITSPDVDEVLSWFPGTAVIDV